MVYFAEKVHLKNPSELKEVKDFLQKFDLGFEDDIDYTVAIREQGEIVATCSKAKDVLKCFAIDNCMQGTGITNIMLKSLQDKLFEEGIFHSYIFTKPVYESIFTSLGYSVVEKVDKVVLLEGGMCGIGKFLDKISSEFSIDSSTPKAALVMNCNPFTLGHRYLVERASANAQEVLLFVVEENKSLFPFDVRYDLVKKGVSDLKNVKVIPGGKYIISSATFPAYFLRESGEFLQAYTTLDAKIFANYFCRKFNILERFVGEEPYCDVTNSYNAALSEILVKSGVNVHVIKRKEGSEETGYISASKVRESIRENDGINSEELSRLIPESTMEFFETYRGKEIIEKIIVSYSPH
ncbi:[citrate (pro-3S)-lyase] ligase [uncultured Ilyobacter sp.]|uniref:[citrate (pro-3S)-lyase] ligase n=1 Tax=uncultured Ilyobacter sp. TaxID=544433 RepID=UPI0029C7C6A3|nr:[citrate (pro-3S)-lyase] ligase [uncultured Ilyobacter sp.]